MTRQETLAKLLALGPMHRADLARCTGWGVAETAAEIDQLLAGGVATYFPRMGNTRIGERLTGQVICLPGARAAALEVAEVKRREQTREAVRRQRSARPGAWR